MNRSQIGQYESGEQENPSIETIARLAEALGCDLHELTNVSHVSLVRPIPDFPATPTNEMQSLLQIIRDQQAMMERQRADGALMMERHHAVIQEQQAMAERQRQDVARLTEVLSRQQELFAELVRSKSVPGADPAMDRIREIDRKNAHGRPLKEVIGESSQDKEP